MRSGLPHAVLLRRPQLRRPGRVPALFSVGLEDEITPPSTVFAAYNEYTGPKDIRGLAVQRPRGARGRPRARAPGLRGAPPSLTDALRPAGPDDLADLGPARRCRRRGGPRTVGRHAIGHPRPARGRPGPGGALVAGLCIRGRCHPSRRARRPSPARRHRGCVAGGPVRRRRRHVGRDALGPGAGRGLFAGGSRRAAPVRGVDGAPRHAPVPRRGRQARARSDVGGAVPHGRPDDTRAGCGPGAARAAGVRQGRGGHRAGLDRLGGTSAWSTGFAHGDFAPVNVVIRDDDLVLLDLGGLCVAPRILDLAWWGWIVRFHHPEAWADTWGVFLDAAGMPSTGELDAPAASVARLLLLERAADADGRR